MTPRDRSLESTNPTPGQRPASLSPAELARLTGVSTETLRHYERKKVLASPVRLSNGYRRHSADAVTGVQ